MDRAEEPLELASRIIKSTNAISMDYRQAKYASPRTHFVLHMSLSDVVLFGICAYDSVNREKWPDQSRFIEGLPVEWDVELTPGNFLVLPLKISKQRSARLERIQREERESGKNS